MREESSRLESDLVRLLGVEATLRRGGSSENGGRVLERRVVESLIRKGGNARSHSILRVEEDGSDRYRNVVVLEIAKECTDSERRTLSSHETLKQTDVKSFLLRLSALQFTLASTQKLNRMTTDLDDSRQLHVISNQRDVTSSFHDRNESDRLRSKSVSVYLGSSSDSPRCTSPPRR